MYLCLPFRAGRNQFLLVIMHNTAVVEFAARRERIEKRRGARSPLAIGEIMDEPPKLMPSPRVHGDATPVGPALDDCDGLSRQHPSHAVNTPNVRMQSIVRVVHNSERERDDGCSDCAYERRSRTPTGLGVSTVSPLDHFKIGDGDCTLVRMQFGSSGDTVPLGTRAACGYFLPMWMMARRTQRFYEHSRLTLIDARLFTILREAQRTGKGVNNGTQDRTPSLDAAIGFYRAILDKASDEDVFTRADLEAAIRQTDADVTFQPWLDTAAREEHAREMMAFGLHASSSHDMLSSHVPVIVYVKARNDIPTPIGVFVLSRAILIPA